MNPRRTTVRRMTCRVVARGVPKGVAAALLVGLSAGLVGCGAGEAPKPGAASPSTAENCAPLPDGFAYLNQVDDTIDVELKYSTPANFTGAVVDGYASATTAVLRRDAAEALARVQRSLAPMGLELRVYDAFRPTRAVADFVAWSKTGDDSTQDDFYPTFEKPELFERGYIAEQSGHSLGGTVDVTLVDVASGEPLDMGGPFDFFDERSHYEAEGLTGAEFARRTVLREAMLAEDFEPYAQEWWHFSYPVPDDAERLDFALPACE